ncbi:hypothetical protein JCM2811A_06050 [Methylorubrum rhodinum]
MCLREPCRKSGAVYHPRSGTGRDIPSPPPAPRRAGDTSEQRPAAWETLMSFFIGIAGPWLIVSGLLLMWHRRAEETSKPE